jgi:hypothetical protein
MRSASRFARFRVESSSRAIARTRSTIVSTFRHYAITPRQDVRDTTRIAALVGTTDPLVPDHAHAHRRAFARAAARQTCTIRWSSAVSKMRECDDRANSASSPPN